MNLLDLMKNKNLTGYSLSKESGISYTTIKEILNGKRKIENLPGKTILALANVFECSMEDVMSLEIKYKDNFSYKRKSDYYCDLLKNKKNVILSKDSALEFYHLSNDSVSDNVFVYSCGDLQEPYICKKVDNFNDIDYQIVDGVMVTTLSQTINDIISDDDTDLQPLYEALNKYFYTHDNSFENIDIEEANKKAFERIVQAGLEYYDEE